MTKKEIVKAISEELGLTQLQTKAIVQKTFESIIDTLVEDPKHRIELRNFGVFEVKKRAARKARNPRTNERVDVEEKYVVTFKPGKEMEERVGRLKIEGDEEADSVPPEHSPSDSSASQSPAGSPESSSDGQENVSSPATPPEQDRAPLDPPQVSSPYNP